jgi:hypothetical protein
VKFNAPPEVSKVYLDEYDLQNQIFDEKEPNVKEYPCESNENYEL